MAHLLKYLTDAGLSTRSRESQLVAKSRLASLFFYLIDIIASSGHFVGELFFSRTAEFSEILRSYSSLKKRITSDRPSKRLQLLQFLEFLSSTAILSSSGEPFLESLRNF